MKKDDIKEAIESLANATVEFIQWFSNNQMKTYPDKCHLRTSKSEATVVNVENNSIKNSKCEKLLGVKIDCKLIFNSYIDKICKKTGQKMNAFSKNCKQASKNCIHSFKRIL